MAKSGVAFTKLLAPGDALHPKLWPSVSMADGDNPNQIAPNHVGDVVAEHGQVHPTITFAAQSRPHRIRLDLGDEPVHLDFEPNPETQFLFLVVVHRGPKLRLGLMQKNDSHRGNRESNSFLIS